MANVLIEATEGFEQDLARLSHDEHALTVNQINACAKIVEDYDANTVYHYVVVNQPPLAVNLNGYESSLYTLRVSPELGIVFAVDEDPMFDQVLFTLFRVVHKDMLNDAYQSVAKLLYQDLISPTQETAKLS